VQIYTSAGNGPWSDAMNFTVSLPGAATLVSPTASILTNMPDYTWNVVPGATEYYLWVNGPSGNVIQTWYTAAEANCDETTCSVTPDALSFGAYTWWVRTSNDVGNGPWSAPMNFTVVLPPPGTATLASPEGEIGATYNPTYTWDVVSDATWYYLWVNGPSGSPVIQTWYTAEQANCDETSCSVTPSISLGAGAHTWWIQTWNPVGYGDWSAAMDFTVVHPPPPGQATLSSPAGSIGISKPTYTWNVVPGATWYYLWVNGPSGSPVTQIWYTAAQANCGVSTCSVTPSTALSVGAHRWWIRTWNGGGYGPWSDPTNFSFALPGQATLSIPSGSISTNQPTYTWDVVPGATWYYLWVNGPSGSPVIQTWYTAAQANCNETTCSVTPTTTLGAGAHRWWIQTWNDAGYGPWSAARNFTAP
jgi:hypothetical protein